MCCVLWNVGEVSIVNLQLRKNLYWRNFDLTWRGFNEWILVLIIGFVIQNRRGHGGHDESWARRALPAACRKLRKRSLLSNFLGPNLRHRTETLVGFLKKSSKNHQPDFTFYMLRNHFETLTLYAFNQFRYRISSYSFLPWIVAAVKTS